MPAALTFDNVPANDLDTITLPPGFSWRTVVCWGDPLWSSGTEFDAATGGTGESQELAFGDSNDGMEVFSDGRHVLLAANNEYINKRSMFANRSSGHAETLDDIRKSKAGHGVSVAELQSQNGAWHIVKDSQYNRRITADTVMEITGPARGHQAMHTGADRTGTISLGTWNNCGCGRTPWGTYLTCEENFNGYYSLPAIRLLCRPAR